MRTGIRTALYCAGAAMVLVGPVPASIGWSKAPAAKAAHRDRRQEARNRALVLEFCEAVYNKRDFAIAERLLDEDFIQHNPKIPTGRQAFIDSYAGVVAHRPGLHSQILRSAASGDLVWTHVHVTDAGTYQMALINIFRVAHGKIVEHWDVIQAVPDTAANQNTMF